MKKIIQFLSFLLLQTVSVEAQRFGSSLGCNINVNDPIISMGTWRPIVGATFKFSRPDPSGVNGQYGTSCTGTLINRKTSDGSLGFYFVTARHCFIDGTEPTHNFNNDYYFYFNYQSRDGNNLGTALSNRGNRIASQTQLYDGPSFNDTDYHYGHRSKIRVVADFQWGDFILCEILTPLPPHFDVTYAGWNPSPFRTPLSGPFRGVHHPRGDIKKASLALNMYWLKNPIASGCYSITKLIDVLFGGIWRRRWSTSVICKYVEVPYFYVNWGLGGTEGGSSGSGMFQGNGKLIGTLKGGPYKACNQDVFVIDHYGKFWVSYPNKVVKNTMNPENDWWTDIVGMPERKITCYPNLNLPGVTGVSGEYVPAFQHQSENTITLQAINNITTNAPINIYDSADYRFRAGNTIILDNGFDARPGSTFIAEIGGCQTGVNQKKPDPNEEILNALSQITVPKKKDFDASKYVEGSLIESGTGLLANIYPNPNNGQFAVKLSKAGDYTLRISDMLGKLIYTSQISNTTEFKIQLSGYAAGNYLVQINSSSEQFVGKVVITE